ncbi:MAG: 5-methylcytosine restriction system specificity protein McrC [Gammaproteobacteria bacterium]
MTARFITGFENKPLNFSDHPDLEDSFRATVRNFQDEKTLGLHFARGGICPGNFIGMVWIGAGESRVALQVNSKFEDEEMDYIKMFAECAAHPEIGARLGGCLHFWADEELIDAPEDSDFLILTALAYLRELNELCRRHLRRHFLRETRNFCGKVKGKILVGENLRQNIVRARPDRIVCEYQNVGDDILENRVLRAALERAARYISRHKLREHSRDFSAAERWIRSCRAALSCVPISPIHRSDFSSVRRRGAFVFYRKPLALAKAVLLSFGFNPRKDIPEKTKTPPFALDSAELFERYAQLKLLEQFPNLRALYERGTISGGNADGFDFPVRPDFYISRENEQPPQIIDAKYKRFSVPQNEKNADEKDNGDFYQIVAYSRHRGLLEKMRCRAEDEIKLSLAYPRIGESGGAAIQEENKTGAFLRDVHILKIECPKKPAD